MKHLLLKRITALISVSAFVSSLGLMGSALLLSQPVTANTLECGVKDNYRLPCWKDFLDSKEGAESMPLYPYAKRPNGCSIGENPGEYDNVGSHGYNFSFKEVCNAHDKCYYTLGTSPEACNAAFAAELAIVCRDNARQLPSIKVAVEEVLSSGGSRLAAIKNCYDRAKVMTDVTIAVQYKYHKLAQDKQARYIKKVNDFITSSRPRIIDGQPGFIFTDDSSPFIVPKPNSDNPTTVLPPANGLSLEYRRCLNEAGTNIGQQNYCHCVHITARPASDCRASFPPSTFERGDYL
ncbi:MAG: hypothetical protein KME38_20685 [Spirirestis rafaelensis WJT71-NPBG6]|jgi:hypothetical protein|nr:hypothetical protein [Spirirestis rafaelensis WJT71-NPBG6]